MEGEVSEGSMLSRAGVESQRGSSIINCGEEEEAGWRRTRADGGGPVS